ncbi:MAG: hypothetical protein M1812_004370 [Candelaria pacifica]|nr:MAG: hypothetical protein M1812_004370 [Candelaria pacifica]
MSPENKVDVFFGIIEVLIGLVTIAVGFASYLQTRENRRRVPPAVAGPVLPRTEKVPAHNSSHAVRGEIIRPPNTHNTGNHKSGAVGTL